MTTMSRFLSTPSARRATDDHVQICDQHAISIHALREEGDPFFFSRRCHPVFISIHALREEGDQQHSPDRRELSISIHALREEGDVFLFVDLQLVFFISIHALREEGDYFTSCLPSPQKDFYPRPPRGGRRSGQLVLDCINLFLSTPSARRATQQGTMQNSVQSDFYPRPPRGGRPG